MTDLEIFSVQEINNHIKNLLENNIPNLYVEGEITNFVRHTSGHIYFSVKDDLSSLKCVFFRQNNYSLDFIPKDGDRVILYGNISLYVKGGTYQFNVRNLFSSGKGLLQIKFEQLKNKLESEGLFSREKKAIPKYPQRVGLITSPTGAAIEDIKNVIFRRYPVELILYPALVQGDGAASSLVEAVHYFSQNPLIDILIIARGGGSQEDLFVFNNEELVRAIYACPIPVISGVGHEIDFTLTDFVADLRAPTPSAAAELAVPDRKELGIKLKNMARELGLHLQTNLHWETNRLNKYEQRLNNARLETKIQQKRIELLEVEKSFTAIGNIPDFLRQKLGNSAILLHNHFSTKSSLKIEREKNNLTRRQTELDNILKSFLLKEKHNYELCKSKIESHSPLEILKQGYAYISQNDKLISRAAQIDNKSKIKIKFYDKVIEANIIEKED